MDDDLWRANFTITNIRVKVYFVNQFNDLIWFKIIQFSSCS